MEDRQYCLGISLVGISMVISEVVGELVGLRICLVKDIRLHWHDLMVLVRWLSLLLVRLKHLV